MKTPTIEGFAATAMKSAQELGQLNMATFQTAATEFSEMTKALMSVKSPAEVAPILTAVFQGAPAKAQAYGQHVSEILSRAQA